MRETLINTIYLNRFRCLYRRKYGIKLVLSLDILILTYYKPNRLYEWNDLLYLNKFYGHGNLNTALLQLVSLGYLEMTEFKTKFRLSVSGVILVEGFISEYTLWVSQFK
jgi:hypothetical protein